MAERKKKGKTGGKGRSSDPNWTGGPRTHQDHFHAGASSSQPHTGGGSGSTWGDTPGNIRVDIQSLANNLKRDPKYAGFSDRQLLEEAKLIYGWSNVPRESRPFVPEIDTAPMHASRENIRDVSRVVQQQNWRSNSKHLFSDPDVATGRRPPKSVDRFMKEDAPPEMVEFLRKELANKNSDINSGLDITMDRQGGKFTPAQRRRLKKLTDHLQKGGSFNEAYMEATSDRRGQGLAAPGAKKPTTGREPQYQRATGRRSKYESVVPTAREFRFGVSAPAVDKMAQLRAKFPDVSDQDLIAMQQFQRVSIADEFLQNNAWAQETRRARIAGKGKEDSGNRVVVFTTSLGLPTVSVPSDSLPGQYVLRQRKKILAKQGVPASALHGAGGAIPAAVRDMHINELSTGISFGAQGAWGAFNRTGWKLGKKTSKNWGKATPLGSQLMYNSQGQPVYNAKGDLVFTDGAIRRFSLGTTKDLGLRIFVG